MKTVGIRIPKYHLGDVPVEDLPDYLVPVRTAADMLHGTALHPGTKEGRDTVLDAVDDAIAYLKEAKEAILKLEYIMPSTVETMDELKAGETRLEVDVSRHDLEPIVPQA